MARAWLEYIGTLTPIQEIANRPDFPDKLAALKQAARDTPWASPRIVEGSG